MVSVLKEFNIALVREINAVSIWRAIANQCIDKYLIDWG